MRTAAQLSEKPVLLRHTQEESGPSVDSAQQSCLDQHRAEPAQPYLIGRERNARLVVFSGVDCSGKSTQISLLINTLTERGEKPFYFWSRVGYTPGFEVLKTALRRAV